jgi:chromosome segregation ATPase
MDTTAAMNKLVEARERANDRVRELEAEQRLASQTLVAARETLVQFERRGGGRPAERRQLEEALAKAKKAAEEPWSERLEGARRAARDAQHEVQRFVAEHLAELVEAREVDGQAAAERINTAAAEMLAGYQEWSQVATEINGLLALVGPVRPGDVSFTRCEALAREASTLLREGGEQAPVVRHRPGEPRYGLLPAVPEPVSA